jgi:hypothetical protein
MKGSNRGKSVNNCSPGWGLGGGGGQTTSRHRKPKCYENMNVAGCTTSNKKRQIRLDESKICKRK